MKKIVVFVLVGVLLGSTLGAVAMPDVMQGISIEKGAESNTLTSTVKETLVFSKPSFTINGAYTVVSSSNSNSLLMTPGAPMLPVYAKTFLFKPGTVIKNINCKYSGTHYKLLSKEIMPAPEPVMRSEGTLKITSSQPFKIIGNLFNKISVFFEKILSRTSPRNTPDSSISQPSSPAADQTPSNGGDTNNEVVYNSALYPEQNFKYTTGQGILGNSHWLFVTVYTYPVRYIPTAKKVIYTDSTEITINYDASNAYDISTVGYNLLILTPSEFVSPLQKLVEHKNSIDISTKLVTLNEIYQSTYFPVQGIDDPEKVKYFIKNAIENWGITNVLIVGSGLEGAEKFPVRYAYVPSDPYEDSFPSDLYYADIYDSTGGFSTWDKDGDGKYAEYISSHNNDMSAVDIYPDVYLGRLPCDNTNEVSAVVNKIIDYKQHNKMMNKIVQVGGDTFPEPNDNIYEGEYANAAVYDKLKSSYATQQLWGSNGQLTVSNIASAINKGVDFADFSGHGSPISWATHPPNNDKTWIPQGIKYDGFISILHIYLLLNQKKLPVFVLNACSNNKYSESLDSLGWSIVRKSNGGGIATFAASGIGYGMGGSSETQRLQGWMEVHIFEELYNTKNLGKVWSNAITRYTNAFKGNFDDGDYKTVLETLMIGDPTVNIQDGDDPVNIDSTQTDSSSSTEANSIQQR